jgi:predicted aspartyl protease
MRNQPQVLAKWGLVLMTCVAGAALVSCASREPVSDREWPTPRGYCTSSNGLTTVSLEQVGAHYLVQAKVNGQPLRLMLDTGAEVSLITPKAARQAGFEGLEECGMSGFGGGTMRSGQLGFARRIELGAAVVENSPAVVAPLPRPFARALDGTGGILGSSFLQHFVSTIDLARSNITLCAADRFTAASQGAAIPMLISSSPPRRGFFLPCIEGEIDGVKAVFVLDTGMDASVQLRPGFVVKHAYGQSPVKKSAPLHRRMAGIGGNTRSQVVRGRTLVLGGLTVPGPLVEMPVKDDCVGMDCDAVLGLNVWKRFEVTLDYPDRRVWLHPNANYDLPAEIVCTCPGWRLRAVADGWKVAKVKPDSAAADAGLRAGDIILTIDGQPATAAALAQRNKSRSHGPVGTQIRLRAKSPRSSARDVTITLRDIL